MNVISRKEAILTNNIYYFTGKPCKHGHFSKRLVCTYGCYECSKISHRKNHKRYYLKNSEKLKKYSAKQRKNFPEKTKLCRNKSNSKWTRNNRDKRNAISAKYRASKLNATPVWVNDNMILFIYSIASERNMEVDHIFPLQSDWVCGLHCEDNLQLLSSIENRIKGNRK